MTNLELAIEQEIARVQGAIVGLEAERAALVRLRASLLSEAVGEQLPPVPLLKTSAAPQARPARKHVRSGSPWTDAELATLREKYPKIGGKECHALIPNHSYASLLQKAKVLGLRIEGRARRGEGKKSPAAIEVKEVLPPVQPPKRPRTFEEQLEAVANGAKLVEVVPIRRADPSGTLGGVTGEIL